MAESRKVVWFTLSLDLFMWGLINNLFGPSVLKIMDEFKIDFTIAGIAVTAMSIGGMFSIFIGRLADKYGSYNVCRIGLLSMGFLTAFTGFSTGYMIFFLFSFLTGISIGAFQSSFNQVILDLYPESKIKMLSLSQVFFGVGATIGPTVTASIISSLNDWRLAYILFGGVLVAFMIFQFFLKSSTKSKVTLSDEKEGSSHFFVMLLIGIFLLFLIGTGVNSWLPTFVVKTGKATYLEAGVILSCFWGTGTVMRGLVGKAVDKMGEKKLLVSFSFLCFISSILSLYAIGLIPNAIIWGIAGLAFAPIYPLVIATAYNKYRRSPGKIIGRLVAIGNVGGLIAAPLIGIINGVFDPNIATLVIPLSGLAITIVFFRMKI